MAFCQGGDVASAYAESYAVAINIDRRWVPYAGVKRRAGYRSLHPAIPCKSTSSFSQSFPHALLGPTLWFSLSHSAAASHLSPAMAVGAV